jgi:hypothetical protein
MINRPAPIWTTTTGASSAYGTGLDWPLATFGQFRVSNGYRPLTVLVCPLREEIRPKAILVAPNHVEPTAESPAFWACAWSLRLSVRPVFARPSSLMRLTVNLQLFFHIL